MDDVTTGQRIRERRRQLGFSRRDVAEIADVSAHTVGNIETGVGNPTLRVVVAVLEAVGLTLSVGTIEPPGKAALLRRMGRAREAIASERVTVSARLPGDVLPHFAHKFTGRCRVGTVLNHGKFAGQIFQQADDIFRFVYDAAYVATGGSPVSRTLPVREEPYTFDTLPVFFAGLVAEGGLRKLQHRMLKIDEKDTFGLLLETASDPIGSVSVVKA